MIMRIVIAFLGTRMVIITLTGKEERSPLNRSVHGSHLMLFMLLKGDTGETKRESGGGEEDAAHIDHGGHR